MTAVDLGGGNVLEVKGEAYYLSRNTREAVEGFITTNTERFGQLSGVGWYGQISFWPCCADALVPGEAGVYRPYTIPEKGAVTKRGIEVSALAAGINASYDGASRNESTPDANTPVGDVEVYQVGGAIQYWWSWNFRAAIYYFAYLAPDAGVGQLATVPDALPRADGSVGTGTVHHELAARLAISF